LGFAAALLLEIPKELSEYLRSNVWKNQGKKFQVLETVGAGDDCTHHIFQGLPLHFVPLLVAARQPLLTSSRVEALNCEL